MQGQSLQSVVTVRLAQCHTTQGSLHQKGYKTICLGFFIVIALKQICKRYLTESKCLH